MLGRMQQLCTGFALTEAPVYEPETGAILFSDAIGGGFYRSTMAGEVDIVVPHRKGIGGAAAHASGGVIVSGRNVALKAGADTIVLLANELGLGHSHFNDIGTDSQGRLYAGLVDLDPARLDGSRQRAVLYRIDLDGSATIVDDGGVDASNGIVTSPDGSVLYVADTLISVVWQFDLASDGSLSNRRSFIEWPDDGGPDGLAVDSEGFVWAALHHGMAVARVDPDGKEQQRIAVPRPTTSVCFGGDDLRTLFVTTAGDHGAGDTAGNTGSVYWTTVEQPGLAVTPCAVQPAA
jgi:sugar lactone lactonase YvrE